MDSGKAGVPSLTNSSCSHRHDDQSSSVSSASVSSGHSPWTSLDQAGPSADGVVKAVLLLLLSGCTLVANLLVLLALSSRRYARVVQPQPRYLLASLACTDLLTSLLVLPPAVYPALYSCWPYGDALCQAQALLHGALAQQSSLLLVWMSLDRYLCLLHPRKYRKLAGSKGVAALAMCSWVLVLVAFASLVLPRRGATLGPRGWPGCVPAFPSRRWRVVAVCALYFPPTLATMYCYGTAFHRAARALGGGVSVATAAAAACGELPEASPLHMVASSPPPPPPVTSEPTSSEARPPEACEASSSVASEHASSGGGVGEEGNNDGGTNEGEDDSAWRLRAGPSRTMAALSLSFIVVVTPWTTHEVVVACTDTETPAAVQFAVTWVARSSGLWNALLYWLTDTHFRSCASHLFHRHRPQPNPPASPGCPRHSPQQRARDELPDIPLPPPPPPPTIPHQLITCPLSSSSCEGSEVSDSPTGGRVLQRASSSSSLQALRRMYGHGLGPPLRPSQQNATGQRHWRCQPDGVPWDV